MTNTNTAQAAANRARIRQELIAAVLDAGVANRRRDELAEALASIDAGTMADAGQDCSDETMLEHGEIHSADSTKLDIMHNRRTNVLDYPGGCFMIEPFTTTAATVDLLLLELDVCARGHVVRRISDELAQAWEAHLNALTAQRRNERRYTFTPRMEIIRS